MFALLFTTTSALLFAGIGIVASDSYLFYSSLQKDLQILGEIIADRSIAPLTFDDASLRGNSWLRSKHESIWM